MADMPHVCEAKQDSAFGFPFLLPIRLIFTKRDTEGKNAKDTRWRNQHEDDS